MKKFFLFRKEEINLSSVTASDTGAGVSVFAVPADSLAFATASKGYVKLTFNDASIYEESNLTDGESMEKTTVVVPCEEGEEMALIQAILVYVSRDAGKPVMTFDAVGEGSIFDSASASSEILAKVRVNPTKRITGKPSTQTFIGSSGSLGIDIASNEIAGIDFGISSNKPIVDYNHEGLESKTVGHEINSWDNAGTGGNTYDIGSNSGAPVVSNSEPKISKRSASLASADHFIIPTLTVSNDYTIYAVFKSSEAFPLYSDNAGENIGFTAGDILYTPSGAIGKTRGSVLGNFKVRHADRLGAPAESATNDTSNGTVRLRYPEFDKDGDSNLMVFVIRRDADFNMYMYDKNGSLVAFIPSLSEASVTKTSSSPSTVSSIGSVSQPSKLFDNTDGRTDGDLKIEKLGTGGGASFQFAGSLARFGVIPNDIGSASCSKLATDLFQLYS